MNAVSTRIPTNKQTEWVIRINALFVENDNDCYNYNKHLIKKGGTQISEKNNEHGITYMSLWFASIDRLVKRVVVYI